MTEINDDLTHKYNDNVGEQSLEPFKIRLHCPRGKFAFDIQSCCWTFTNNSTLLLNTVLRITKMTQDKKPKISKYSEF